MFSLDMIVIDILSQYLTAQKEVNLLVFIPDLLKDQYHAILVVPK